MKVIIVIVRIKNKRVPVMSCMVDKNPTAKKKKKKKKNKVHLAIMFAGMANQGPEPGNRV